jgi:hypothetical protein
MKTKDTSGPAPAAPEREDGNKPCWGASAIGKVINKDPRATSHLLRRGALPSARKIGREWCASPDGLRRDLGLAEQA